MFSFKFHIKQILFLSFCVLTKFIQAQQVEEIATKFPNALAAFQSITRDVKISNKNNSLYIETTEESELLMLNEKASGIYNKGRVYHGSFDEVKLIEAYTKFNDGNKIRKIKVNDFKTESSQSNSIFYDDAKETVFDFPSTIKGSVCYQKSVIVEKDYHLLTPFYFSTYLPAISTKFSIEYPSNVQLKYIIKNNSKGFISVSEDSKGKTVKLEFSASNLLPRDYYSNGPAASATEPHVIFYIGSFTNEENKEVKVFETMKDFYKWNFKHLASVNKEPNVELQSLTDSLTKPFKTQKEKAQSIFKWVQSNIKYVAFEDGLEGFVPRQAKDVCSKKYGDCKDMASLLTVMLNQAGIKAHYTWIGTRSIAYDYNDVHLPITDNHMICAANIENKWIFLDATDPNCIFEMPTDAIQSKQALIAIDDDNFVIERVPTIDYSINTIVDTTKIFLKESGIKGSIAIHFTGYCGSDTYNYLEHKDESQIKDYVKARLSKGSNKFIVNDYAINKYNTEKKELSMNGNFELAGYAKQIGDEYYINLNLDKYQTNTFIDTSKRKVDVSYDFKFNWKQYTILNIPEGYEVSYIPKNYKTDIGDFAYEIKYETINKQIVLSQQFINNTLMFAVDKFNDWNKTVKDLNSQFKEQVVLKKIK